MRTEGIVHLKIFKDPTRNRTRNIPSCGAEPQPTVRPNLCQYPNINKLLSFCDYVMHYEFYLLRPCPSPKCYLVFRFLVYKNGILFCSSHSFSPGRLQFLVNKVALGQASFCQYFTIEDQGILRCYAVSTGCVSTQCNLSEDINFYQHRCKNLGCCGTIRHQPPTQYVQVHEIKSQEVKKLNVYSMNYSWCTGWGERISVACFWHPRHIQSYLWSCC